MLDFCKVKETTTYLHKKTGMTARYQGPESSRAGWQSTTNGEHIRPLKIRRSPG
jgi:hypothetical protein